MKIKDSDPERIMEQQDRLQAAEKFEKFKLIEQRKKFGRCDRSTINGRPHHLAPWRGGLLFGIYTRRAGHMLMGR